MLDKPAHHVCFHSSLVDEPTANVDKRTDELLQVGLNKKVSKIIQSFLLLTVLKQLLTLT